MPRRRAAGRQRLLARYVFLLSCQGTFLLQGLCAWPRRETLCRGRARVYGAIRKLGGSERTVGYYYAAYGIQLALEQPQRMMLITKWLQPDIARKYKTTSAAVERGIRLLIHHMWKSQTPAWQELFPDGKRPTVSELFPIMVDYLSYEDAS